MSDRNKIYSAVRNQLDRGIKTLLSQFAIQLASDLLQPEIEAKHGSGEEIWAGQITINGPQPIIMDSV